AQSFDTEPRRLRDKAPPISGSQVATREIGTHVTRDARRDRSRVLRLAPVCVRRGGKERLLLQLQLSVQAGELSHPPPHLPGEAHLAGRSLGSRSAGEARYRT